MLIRLALFASMGLAIFSGLWATWKDPTPENAAAAIHPTPAQIQETNEKVQPVLEWIFSQTPDSVIALLIEAKDDVASKVGMSADDIRPAASKSPSGYGAPASAGGSPADPELPPGIDWYKKE